MKKKPLEVLKFSVSELETLKECIQGYIYVVENCQGNVGYLNHILTKVKKKLDSTKTSQS